MLLDIAVTAWELTYMLIALLIPVLVLSMVTRVFIKSGKKTIRSVKS
jgi:hypothetical protein